MTSQPLSLRHLLSLPGFAKLWLSRFCAMLGIQMVVVVLSWNVYDLSHDPMALGLLGIAEFVPILLFTIPGGLLSDRLPRNRVFASCMTLLLLASVMLFLAEHLNINSVPLFLGIAAMLGINRSFQVPAEQSLVATIVPKNNLAQAVAFSSSGLQTAFLAGPVLGGFLFDMNREYTYFVCAGLFTSAFLLTSTITCKPAQSDSRTDWKSIFAGIHFVMNSRIILGALSLDMMGVFLGSAVALLPIFAKDIFTSGTTTLGLLRAAPAMGGALMAYVLIAKPLHSRIGLSLILSIAVYGMATLGFAYSTNLMLSLGLLAVIGAADQINKVARQPLVQVETPDKIRSRVTAVSALFSGTSNHMGEFRSGLTATWWGVVPSVAIGGLCAILCSVVWIRLFPTLWARNHLNHSADFKPNEPTRR